MNTSFLSLHPEWIKAHDGVGRYIKFDCPKCPPSEGCVTVIPVDGAPSSWILEDSNFETFTLSPSIFHHCKSEAHYFIKNGVIDML